MVDGRWRSALRWGWALPLAEGRRKFQEMKEFIEEKKEVVLFSRKLFFYF